MSELIQVRVSVRKDDVGYMDNIHRHAIKVFVDGVDKTTDCHTIDERKGYIAVIKRTDGEIDTDGDKILEQVIRGDVRIEGLSEQDREAHHESMSHRRIMPDASTAADNE